MVNMEPFAYHETKNIDEHNQIVSKINELVTDRNATDGQFDAVKQTANTALAVAGTAQQTADDAKTLATTADGKATTNAANIGTNAADIGTLNGLMAYMNSNAFITVVFNKTATAITAVFTRKDGSTYSANLPLATTTTAGFMDSAMKQQLDANTNAIVVLQSQYPTIFVTLPSASPTQEQIQSVYDNYRTAYPAINLPVIPAQGFTMIDTTNNVTVEYDKVSEQWVFSTNAISKATNSTYGVLVGEENGADGSLYIVAGKALVNGFDDLSTRVTNAENEIAVNTSDITTNKNNITANTLQIATNLVAINGKETKMIDSTVTVETTAWVTNTYGNATDYPYMAVATISGMTADYVPMVVYGESDTFGGTYSGNAISGSGNVTIFTNAVPETSIIIRVIGKV